MINRIWIGSRYRTIRKDKLVMNLRNVESFIVANNLRPCLCKQQGGYYKIELDGTLKHVCKFLNRITYEELYKALKDN